MVECNFFPIIANFHQNGSYQKQEKKKRKEPLLARTKSHDE